MALFTIIKLLRRQIKKYGIKVDTGMFSSGTKEKEKGVWGVKVV